MGKEDMKTIDAQIFNYYELDQSSSDAKEAKNLPTTDIRRGSGLNYPNNGGGSSDDEINHDDNGR